MLKFLIWISFFIVVVCPNSYGQGCSDAGICTLPSFRPQKESVLDENIHELKAGIAYGNGEYTVAAIDPFIGYNLTIKRYRLETRLTYGIRTGNNMSINDFGDAFIINSFQFTDKFSFAAGVKFPIEFNKKINEHAHLPMAYQPSLGTIDVIAGMTFRISKMQIAFGIQQPVKTLHENFFILNTFQNESHFDRKADILLRLSQPIILSDRFTLLPGLLGIYHVAEDEYLPSRNRETIEGSAGLTINGSFFLDWRVKENGILSANLGFPLLVRNSRPDGLTRSFVIGVDYTFSF